MPFVAAVCGIKDDDTPVLIAIGHVQFIGGQIQIHVCRSTQVLRVVGALDRTRRPDLKQELAFLAEFQQVPIGFSISSQPHVPIGRDIDAVLVFKPVVALAWSSPGADHLALGIQFDDRRSSDTAFGAFVKQAQFVHGQGLRAMNDPDMVVSIHRHPCHLPQDPLMGQGFDPKWVDLKPGAPRRTFDASVRGLGHGPHHQSPTQQQPFHVFLPLQLRYLILWISTEG